MPELGIAIPALVPGDYNTAVNIHNPWNEPANITQRLTLSAPRWRPPISGGDILDTLEPQAAFSINCLNMKYSYGLPADAQVPGGEGFLVIHSDRTLDVVAVYTANVTSGGQSAGVSIDVEYIEPKVAPIAPAPTPVITPTSTPAVPVPTAPAPTAVLVTVTSTPQPTPAPEPTLTPATPAPVVTVTPSPTPDPSATPVLAIADAQGAVGTVVTVDVVFSNPMGTGFSGLGMDVTIEDPAMVEFVDVQLPDWIDPFIVDFLMDFFIAPGGFPTSSIELVVPDLLEQITGVITNEVLATMSLRLISAGETKLLLNLFQLDDDDFGGPNQNNLIPITKAPTSVTITAQ